MAEPIYPSYVGNPAVGLPVAEFLSAEFVAESLEKLMNPMLVWDNLWPKIDQDAPSYTYTEESVSGTRISDSTDPLKEFGVKRTSGAEFAYVSISEMVRKSGAMPQYAMAFKVDEDAVWFKEGPPEVLRAKEKTAQWMAETFNSQVLTDVIGGTDWSAQIANTDSTKMEDIFEHSSDFGTQSTLGYLTGSLDASYYWDDGADANPIIDLIDMGTVVRDQDGYGYKCTDVFLNVPEANLLKKFLVTGDYTWQKSPLGDGITIDDVDGITVHEVKYASGWDRTVGEGYMIGIDQNNPAAVTYRAFNPGYPRTESFSYNQFKKEETHDLHNQMFVHRATRLKEPLGLTLLRVRA